MEDKMNKPLGVTKEIIESFLSEIQEQGVGNDIIERLRGALINDARCGEKALLQAIFLEEES